MLPSSEVKYIKGVGPKRSEALNELGIFSVKDLLLYFPDSYEDRRIDAEDKDFEFRNSVVVKGIVKDFAEIYTSSSLKIFKIIINFGDQINHIAL